MPALTEGKDKKFITQGRLPENCPRVLGERPANWNAALREKNRKVDTHV